MAMRSSGKTSDARQVSGRDRQRTFSARSRADQERDQDDNTNSQSYEIHLVVCPSAARRSGAALGPVPLHRRLSAALLLSGLLASTPGASRARHPKGRQRTFAFQGQRFRVL